MPPSDNGAIDYNRYVPSDEDEMVRLLAGVFPHHDPPAAAVGLKPPEFEAFVRLLCPHVATDGLTFVARSSDTRELTGVLLTEDSASEFPSAGVGLSPKFGPIFDILGQLDAEYRGGRKVRRGESMHLFLLAVDPRFGGNGIAQRLVSCCLEHGAARGYRRSVTEATNKISQHVFRKLGFVERVQRSYQDHRFEGRSIFTSIADQGGPILMERIIRP